MLLDALVSSKPMNHSQALSTGQGVKTRNNMQRMEKHQGKAVMAKVQEVNDLMTQDLVQNLSHLVQVGKDIYEEGDEDEIMQQCRAEAAQRGDLSPMYSGQSKKTHTRKKSWDEKVNEEVNVRRLPMRIAKQE